MDFNKLSQSERIIGISGVLLLLFSFFPWFGLGDGSTNAWDNVLSMLAVIIAVLMVLQVVLSRLTSVQLPTLPVPWGKVHLGLGVTALVLVLLQLIVGDEVNLVVTSVELERKIGVYLGLLAAAGLAAGGFLRSKEPEGASGLSH